MWILLLLLRPYITRATEVSFGVHPTEQKCFGEELARSELLVIKAEMLRNSGKGMMNLIVYASSESNHERRFDKSKSTAVFQERLKPQVNAAFTTTIAGPHWVCIENPDGKDKIEVNFSVKFGAHAKDYSQIAKKDHLEKSDVKLAEILDILKAYHSNMVFMGEREERVQEAHDSTASRVISFSTVNLIIVVLAGGLQLFYFKRFFKSKKII